MFGGTGLDGANAVTADADGNVFVAGYVDATTADIANSGDAVLIKYGADGLKKWTIPFGTPGGEQANAVEVDGNGNIYVSGTVWGAFTGFTNGGMGDAYVAKFDSRGNRLWVIQFGGLRMDNAPALAVDANNIPYVVGRISTNLPNQTEYPDGGGFLMKLNPTDGSITWSLHLSDDAINAITIQGNSIYVAGTTNSSMEGSAHSGMKDVFVARYDIAGNRTWLKTIGSPADDVPNDIIIHGTDVLVAGYTYRVLDGQIIGTGPHVLLLKYQASDGALGWERVSRENGDAAEAIVAADDTLFITGYIKRGDFTSYNNILIRSYDLDGQAGWSVQIGSQGSTSARDIIMVGSELVVVGAIDEALDNQVYYGLGDGLLVRYSQAGCRL